MPNSEDWKPYPEYKPVNGSTVFVWSHFGYDIATYFENDFYRLDLDDAVGCLRKMPVKHKVLSWAVPVLP